MKADKYSFFRLINKVFIVVKFFHIFSTQFSSITTKCSLSNRTARELKNLNITFNDTSWSNENEDSHQQDLEVKKSSRKRKVKNKEDALYSLLNYLLDHIMGKDVSQSFLEPINDEIAPGN